ncbi:MAG TPA: glycosyltransferase family 4 protein [Acidimicrobiia bacterium]|jgi:glycosyltransferase involved in cell wall biosynthesis|nr:glycosyltransferase family 4 protein [Acidimicrobiia bacterium]
MTDNSQGRSHRLAIVVSSDRRRGAEVFGEALAGGIRAQGWEAGLFSLASSARGPRVDATPLSATAPDQLGKLDPAVVRRLRSEMKRYAPDVVLANGAATMQYAVAGLRVMRDRPRLVYSSIGEPSYWIRNRRHRAVRAAILRGVDRVLSVSETTARQLVDHLGVPASKVRVAPTGVPARFFTVEPEPAADELRVIFIGNLSAEKDPLAALDVLTEGLRQAAMTLRYLGAGPLQSALERGVLDRDLGGAVEIMGSVADVLPHLAWADVLLLTSRTEGLPGVPLEAGAAGVPSVVYAAGGAAETVRDGETGRVVAKGDVDAAAAALVELARDPIKRRKWGDAARAMVRERFTLEASVQRYIQLLGDEVRER